MNLAELAENPVVAGRRIVPGEGLRERPALALVGEAPGGEEERLGRPFVGKAGKNLDGFLAALELQREAIWITNVVKVRPTKVSPKGTVSNRPPNREEKALFTPLLLEELREVAPALVVTLGNTALQALLGPEAVIGAYHGRVAPCGALGIPVFALYHPASIIYNRALQSVYEEDLRKLRELLRDSAPAGPGHGLCDRP